ncbi:MAG: PH domain-containing protein, partial [Planctomycetes bacterium]|nr:PH domain-containing protein [Planctomycetota bacterium]
MTTPSEPRRSRVAARRLHPISLLFSLGSAARQLLIPGLVVLLVGRGERTEIFLMVLFVPTALIAVVKYLTVRYELGEDELIVRQGILTRNERHIPYQRIQNIGLVQNPVHRLFRVATVRVETASGKEPEAHLQVLSLDDVREMRQRIFLRDTASRSADEPTGTASATAKPAPPLFAMPISEVLLLGAISARGLAIVGALLGFAWQFDPIERIEEALRSSAEQFEGFGELSFATRATLATVAAVAVVLGMQLLSVAWSLTSFYGFRL